MPSNGRSPRRYPGARSSRGSSDSDSDSGSDHKRTVRRRRHSSSDSSSDSDAGRGRGRGRARNRTHERTRRSRRGSADSSASDSDDEAASAPIQRQLTAALDQKSHASATARDRTGATVVEALVHNLQFTDRAAHGEIKGKLRPSEVMACICRSGIRLKGARGDGHNLAPGLLPRRRYPRDAKGRVSYTEMLRHHGVDAARVVGVRVFRELLAGGYGQRAATLRRALTEADRRAHGGRKTGLLSSGAFIEAVQAVAPEISADQLDAVCAGFEQQRGGAGGRTRAGGMKAGKDKDKDKDRRAGAVARDVRYEDILRLHTGADGTGARGAYDGGDGQQAPRTRNNVEDWLREVACPMEQHNFEDLMRTLAAFEHRHGLSSAQQEQRTGGNSIVMALGPRLKVSMSFHV